MHNQFDDFDMMIQPEELQCDNPIDEDFDPRDWEEEEEEHEDWEEEFIREDIDFLTD